MAGFRRIFHFLPTNVITCSTLGIAFIFAGTYLDSTVPTLDADEVLFVDGMDNPAYTFFWFNGADSGDNVHDLGESDGFADTNGNPGGAYSVQHLLDVDRDFNDEPVGGSQSYVQSLFTKTDFTYNPAVDGEIVDITFQIDLQTSNSFDSVFFLVEDENGGNANGFEQINPNGNWQTITSQTFTNQDFSARDFDGSLQLVFGFGFESTEDVFSSPETHSIKVDNFSIIINTIPEPSSAIFAVALAGLVGMRRRR